MDTNQTLAKIKEQLQAVIDDAAPILNGEEEVTDGTEGIFMGRSELAESLLLDIEKWEDKL